MSLILEALKRSEKERQQQANSVTDALYIEVAPRRRNFWPVLLVVLLLANIGIMAFLWWHQIASDDIPEMQYIDPDTAITTAQEATPTPSPTMPSGGPSRIAARILRPLDQELGNTRIVAAHPPATTHAPAHEPDDTSATPATPPQPTAEEARQKPEPTSASAPKPEPKSEPTSASAPKPGPKPEPTSAPASEPTIGAMDDATLQQLQQYEINIIVYSDNPARRYTLIDMKKLHEGDTLPGSNLRIERIAPGKLIIDTGDGLVSYGGTP